MHPVSFALKSFEGLMGPNLSFLASFSFSPYSLAIGLDWSRLAQNGSIVLVAVVVVVAVAVMEPSKWEEGALLGQVPKNGENICCKAGLDELHGRMSEVLCGPLPGHQGIPRVFSSCY